jgi:4-diphosphocytidyl-2-C-methyl-D-erythritol kinase
VKAEREREGTGEKERQEVTREGASVRVRAHAKINVSLRVAGCLADGYHELRTVFQALALHDTLAFSKTAGPFSLRSTRRELPLDSSNLVWRAADVLWQYLGRGGSPSGVSVHLRKRIPMRAGLGGGSSDAAATIVALARLWDATLDRSDLASLGRRLGADVGFFFTGGAALGLGRGDEIYPLADLPRLGVLLVTPDFDVSTADAYRWLDEARGYPATAPSGRPEGPEPEAGSGRESQSISGCRWPVPSGEVWNDFEAVVAARHPELCDIRQEIIRSGAAAAAMSGSGSTMFGLFEREDAMRAAAASLEKPGRLVQRTRTLSRREYLRSAAPVVP